MTMGLSDDNIIPFPRNIRVQIETEMARAIRNFGHTPDLMKIAHCWGDIMDDEQVLEALRSLNATGSLFDYVPEIMGLPNEGRRL